MVVSTGMDQLKNIVLYESIAMHFKKNCYRLMAPLHVWSIWDFRWVPRVLFSTRVRLNLCSLLV